MTWMISRIFRTLFRQDDPDPMPSDDQPVHMGPSTPSTPGAPGRINHSLGGGASPSVYSSGLSTLSDSVPSLPPPLPSFIQHTNQQSSPPSPMSTNGPHCPGGVVFVIGRPPSTSAQNITPSAQSASQQGRSTSRGRGRNRRGRGRRRFRPYGNVSESLFQHSMCSYLTVMSYACVLNSACVHVSIKISCLWYHNNSKFSTTVTTYL